MSEWVRLDITSFTKTTNREKILKILKGAKVSEHWINQFKIHFVQILCVNEGEAVLDLI